MWKIHILCKNWKTIFEEKLLIFQDISSVVCQEIFSEDASRRSALRKVSWIAGEKWTLKFPVDVGFLCDDTSATAAMLRDIINIPPCSMGILWSKNKALHFSGEYNCHKLEPMLNCRSLNINTVWSKRVTIKLQLQTFYIVYVFLQVVGMQKALSWRRKTTLWYSPQREGSRNISLAVDVISRLWNMHIM
jgi:hypothetical protein